MKSQKAMLVDITQCIGCRSCEQACQESHGLPVEHEPALSATALTVVEERKERFVRRLCMHCQDPACASACPVGGLVKADFGGVVYQADKCIGCRYCMMACPFTVPRYEWSRLAPLVRKCDFCAERVSQGLQPACVEACPVGATTFGDRDEMLAEARRRVRENPAYVQRVYGEEEVGGTSVFYISDVPFEQLGFVTPPLNQPVPTLTAAALGDVPLIVVAGGSILSALYWITNRRSEVALAEGRQEPEGSEPPRRERR